MTALEKQFNHYNETINVPVVYQDLVQQLVHQRHKKNISQEELAHQIGCAKSLVHKWEQYKRVPSGFLLSCWVEALGCRFKIYKQKAKT